MELPGTVIAQHLGHAVQNGGIIRLGLNTAQRAGVQVAEVDAGSNAAVHAAQRQHLVQCAQLSYLAHGLRAQGHILKARLVQRSHSAAHGVQRLFQRGFPALFAAAAGVEDDASAAQRPAHRRALQQVLDAVQPLVLFQTGHTDIIRCMDAKQDVPLGSKGSHAGGLIQPQTHPTPALVLKGVQPHFGGVLRHIQTAFVALGGKAVAGACGAEPDVPSFTHRVLPPRS